MDRRSFEKETREMRRLYVREKLTLREIGFRFKLSFQAVHLRLVNAGVTFQSRGSRPRRIDKRLLERLHIKEQLPIYKIAKLLKAGHPTVRSELKRHGLGPIGLPSANRKYPLLDALEMGDSIRLPLPTGKAKRHAIIYSAAQIRGIRLSVKTLEKELEITRIA
ncbi:MAG: hypothetical protein ABI999_07115 [Acidobacteriota bacterium]